MDQLRKTGTDGLLKKELANGKLMIGESAGAIICAPSIQYIEQMDEKPEDYSQEDDAGLDLIDFYVLPHYLTAPFKKVTSFYLIWYGLGRFVIEGMRTDSLMFAGLRVSQWVSIAIIILGTSLLYFRKQRPEADYKMKN